MQYGPVTRIPVAWRAGDYLKEWPVPGAPAHRYVSVPARRKGGGGITVFGRGTFEYEPRSAGRLGVTVLRAVGDLSRGDLPARPGHAGWPMGVPEAQEIGVFRCELALATRGVAESDAPGQWAEIERLAEEFDASMAGGSMRYAIDCPAEVRGPVLEGEGLAFKSLKPGETGSGLVLRCVNLSSRTVRGSWTFPGPLRAAYLARLDERMLGEISLTGDRRQVPIEAGPRAVVTVVVEP
jgi:alpha-mannosidase